MFCVSCGSQIDDSVRFCPECGAPVAPKATPASEPAMSSYATSGDHPDPIGAAPTSTPQGGYQPGYQAGYQQATQQTQQPGFVAVPPTPTGQAYANNTSTVNTPLIKRKCAESTAAGHPMKWYKFLIYFSLPASALVCIYMAFTLLSGAAWDAAFLLEGVDNGAELIYSTYPAVRALDLADGVLYLATAALNFYTLLQLRKFKKNAPMLVLATYVASLLVTVIYTVGLWLVVPGTDVTDIIPSVIGCILGIVLNKIYFDKRADYFNE